MALQKTQFQVIDYAGTLYACGRAYGEEFHESINLGLDGDFKMKKIQWDFVKKCMAFPWRYKRELDALVEGIAAGSGRTYLDIARLFCEEDFALGRLRNCTAVAATGEGTVDGKPIIGMNWDGMPSIYPWSRLVRFKAKGWPRMLTYSSRPGRFPDAGINEHGMSLVWTTAIWKIWRKPAPPITGVPTANLITGILACKDCKEAVSLLRETPNAGGFVFLLADARKNAWVVEGIPGKIDCIECTDAVGRANHLESPVLTRITRQLVPRSTGENNTQARAKRIWQLIGKHRGRISPAVVEAMLRDTGGRPGHTICRNRLGGDPCLTIDSFYLLPTQREFWIARGLPTRHTFERFKV